jgi:hypothetical protein
LDQAQHAQGRALLERAPFLLFIGLQGQVAFRVNEMKKLTASATLCVGLTLLATQTETQHKTHSGIVRTQREYVRLAEVCAFGFWCDTGILNSNNPAPPRPLVAPKAKLAHGIDRSQFRPEIANAPELLDRGELGHCAQPSALGGRD